MKTLWPILGSLLAALAAVAQPLPGPLITAMPSPGTVGVGQTLTVTMRMYGYTGATEVDSFNFIVSYDPAMLRLVPDSISLGAASGADQQWLSKPPQESLAGGFVLTNANNALVPGFVFVAVGDVGRTWPKRGTRAGSGFLISFQLQALAPGVSAISLQPVWSGSVLLNTALQPILGSVQMDGAIVTVNSTANLPPTVTLTKPFEGAVFQPPTAVLLSAVASDPDGGIARVEFFAGGSLLGQVTNAPFDFTWTNPPAGAHALTAVATDNLGGATTSAPVNILVNGAPVVTLTKPVNGASFHAPASIALGATADDPDGIARVEFYNGGALLAADSNAPYAFTWSGVATGSYSLTARAVDGLGVAAVSAPAVVTVRASNGPPVIAAAGALLEAESAPASGGLDAGETVTVRFFLKNTGGSTPGNVSATLLTGGGVTAPSGEQNYGPLPPGAVIGRAFSFTAFGTNGGSVTATLQVRDEENPLGDVSYTFGLSGTLTAARQGIVIPDSGPGSPYPSTIVIAGLSGRLGAVTLTLSNLSHTFPDDLDWLLTSPGGQKAMVLSDALGPFAVAGLTLTFDDAAPAPPPDNAAAPSGAYRPADYEPGDALPAPAPAGPYGSALSVFRGTEPNGTWSLYAFDDFEGDQGRLDNGWLLHLSTFDPVNPVADLAVTVSDAPDPVGLDSNVTYTVTVTNPGPEAALGVLLTNTLPAGMQFISAAPSQGSCAHTAGVVICDLGALETNAAAVVALVARANLSGLKILTARVGGPSHDFNNANNTASAVTTVLGAADLALTLTDAPDPVFLNGILTLTMLVTNRGPNNATSVTVTNLLAAGAAFLSASPSQGSCAHNAGLVTCPLGGLAAGASATIDITMATPLVPGPLVHRAGVFAASPPDPAPLNNSATALTTNIHPTLNIVAATPMLLAESGPVTGGLDVGETVTMAFHLKNLGTLDTTNLTATLLPTGGVVAPGPVMNYGVLVAGGPAVVRTNTFTASGSPGGLVTATLQLNEGALDLGTVSYHFALGATVAGTGATPLTIPELGVAAPYPSTLAVAGLNGVISRVTVTLSNLTHSYPDDLDVLLASPAGGAVVLMSDAGAGFPVSDLDLTFDDAAAAIPDAFALASGAYRPADHAAGVPDNYPAPAPVPPHATSLGALHDTDPNGVWSLYVVDDVARDLGAIESWMLTVTTVGLVNPRPARLTQPGLGTNGQPRFLLVGLAGEAYEILHSTNLRDWTVVATNTLTTISQWLEMPVSAGPGASRFYRAWRRP